MDADYVKTIVGYDWYSMSNYNDINVQGRYVQTINRFLPMI